ncbi:hypothetical protein [Clostridium grantii]|uniref:Uncharacterized protein n=1 Tax=Clostridium grantii DSM 8605 TaxID=1121316 RepID=A0A1M5XAG0_9CLOT|nr:hypothetical protein [Clostridium grantii]SHH96709.1 hypothetical protein SAMN02745207_03487 [Clostridium grantii DSM 8605]
MSKKVNCSCEEFERFVKFNSCETLKEEEFKIRMHKPRTDLCNKRLNEFLDSVLLVLFVLFLYKYFLTYRGRCEYYI